MPDRARTSSVGSSPPLQAPDLMAPDRFLTAREIADRLGLHVKTVLRYVRTSGLPACRLPGGDLRFEWLEVLEWLGRRKENRT